MLRFSYAEVNNASQLVYNNYLHYRYYGMYVRREQPSVTRWNSSIFKQILSFRSNSALGRQ